MVTAVRNVAALTILFCMSGFMSATDEPLSHETIAKRAKAATIIVEGDPNHALGFCLNASGLFVTNEHVIRDTAEPINLVLNSQLKTEKLLKAKVVRRDKTLDLALLKVEGDPPFETLELGSDKDLSELAELIVCGFPFGTAPGRPAKYPAISTYVGSVTSLRRAKDGELHRIQLDAALDPSDSGGPVLDRNGKVIGMVVSGIPRLGHIPPTGITMAIPVSHLRRFLAPPEITFTPPKITASNQHELFEFTAKAIPIVPSKESLDLELVLGAERSKARHLPMKLTDGVFHAKAIPFPAPEGSLASRVEIPAIPCTIVARQGGVEVGRLATSVCIQDLCRAVPPKLLSPTAGAILENGFSDPGLGRFGSFVWEFSWSEVPGATAYHLYVVGSRATIPVVDQEISSLNYRHAGKGTISDWNRKDWTWKVRSRVNDQWFKWSEVRRFDVGEPPSLRRQSN